MLQMRSSWAVECKRLRSRANADLLSRLRLDPARQLIAAQCSGTLIPAKLGLLDGVMACTDLTTRPGLKRLLAYACWSGPSSQTATWLPLEAAWQRHRDNHLQLRAGLEAIGLNFVVREDAQLLYGFVNKRTRALFRELLKANGVGPKLALAILSGMSASQFVSAVEREEIGLLVKIPGVGKKTAERLVVEMKDRLKGWSEGALFTPFTDAMTTLPGDADKPSSVEDEAVSALLALGYKPQQASLVISKIYKPEMPVEAVIREALRSML